MQVQCDKCNGETKPKKITSKKTGQEYTVYECLEGCKNGKFAYSCFAPRQETRPQPVTNGTKPTEAITLLKSIDVTLKNILVIMQTQTKLVPIQDSELEADENVPF